MNRATLKAGEGAEEEEEEEEEERCEVCTMPAQLTRIRILMTCLLPAEELEDHGEVAATAAADLLEA